MKPSASDIYGMVQGYNVQNIRAAVSASLKIVQQNILSIMPKIATTEKGILIDKGMDNGVTTIGQNGERRYQTGYIL